MLPAILDARVPAHTHTHTGKVHLASNVGMACCKDENKLTVVRYLRLAAVPDNTPLPMTMLSKLWQLSGEQEAEQCANLLLSLGPGRHRPPEAPAGQLHSNAPPPVDPLQA